MAAAMTKAAGTSHNQDSKRKGKRKKCTTCKKTGHEKEDCFEKGRGKADNLPDWWKEKVAKAKSKTANVAKKESDNNDNYTIIAISIEDESDEDTANLVLVITSGHNHDAHAASKSAGVIIDCGASSHFSPNKDKFINYCEIRPEPVKAANGRTFSAIGKGDLKVKLPTCLDHKLMTVTLQGIYYAPCMAFTLISISCLHCAGCSVLIEDNACVMEPILTGNS